MGTFTLEEILKEKGYTDEHVNCCQLLFSMLDTSGARIGHDKVADLLGVVHFWYLTTLYNHGVIGLDEFDGDEQNNIMGYLSRLAQKGMDFVKTEKEKKK